MMPQGFCTAWRNCACVSLRPARSGPKPPSALAAWQFLHEVVFPSQRALPATGSPAGADVCAAASAANIGISRSASKTLFISHSPQRRIAFTGLLRVRFLAFEIAELVQFAAAIAIKFVHFPVPERPSAGR